MSRTLVRARGLKGVHHQHIDLLSPLSGQLDGLVMHVYRLGLNPLRFGASILTRPGGRHGPVAGSVSIPFDSGHRF